ncbi:hypothetical protein ACFL9T_09835 [Thermodesulfobacteriota bacterium]
MKTIIELIALFFLATTSYALEIDPFDGPKPIAVLIQTNPWLMVIGSDTPTMTIYEDGQVIHLKQEKGKAPQYFHTQLSEQELDEVKMKLLSFGNYTGVKREYDLAPNVFDLPETKIYLNLNNNKLVTIVYGLMQPGAKLPAYSSFPGQEKPDNLPDSIKNLHSYLSNFRFNTSKEWTPKFVEVMIWPYEYAPDESIHWPKDWPGLDSPNTLKRRDAYSIFFPGIKIKQLGEFLMTSKPKGAVEIGGKKWAVSVRYTFPSEPTWRKVFQPTDENIDQKAQQ